MAKLPHEEKNKRTEALEDALNDRLAALGFDTTGEYAVISVSRTTGLCAVSVDVLSKLIGMAEATTYR